MYTVIGASGNIGSVISKALLEKGEKVRVVGRHPGNLQQFVQKGAEAIVADVKDADALAGAFAGARAAFLMVPPSMTAPDYRAEQERTSDAIAAAAKKSGLQYAVSLSSFGAQALAGTGPIAGLHRFEKKLNALDRLNILHLRPAYFFENHLAGVGMIHLMSTYGSAIKSDLKFPQIATRDIGAYAASRLLKLDFNGKQTQELLGERDLSMNDVAAVISKALNKSDLRYVQFPYDQFEQVLAQMGTSPKTAAYIIEMFQGMNDGLVVPLELRSSQNSTATSIESFIKDVFLPAYQGKAVSA
jgi:uncharacterized protein YbjT (DUF2867 family)